MSKKEMDTICILKKAVDKEITQKKAAELLKLKTDRQVRNLIAKLKKHGPQGIISKRRGKQSNRAYDTKFKKRVMALVGEKYPDFGPTLAREKLLEYHRITISKETLRKWMVEAHLRVSKRKRTKIHPLRPRRDLFGELIQIDASFHDWFEDRGPRCALIVFIDDATSMITGLHFCETECLQGYFEGLRIHLTEYGRPIGLYADRHAIFGGAERIQHAQFVRAVHELNIEIILASSAQAKGRVERVNQTLQDRLVKELRLRNISTLEAANQYLPEFIKEFNKKFSKEPRGPADAHRPLDGYDLERILTRSKTRTVSKDLSFSFNAIQYKIIETKIIHRLINKKIDIRIQADNSFKVFYKEEELKYIPLKEDSERPLELSYLEKLSWKPRRIGRPRKDHPWKKYGYQTAG